MSDTEDADVFEPHNDETPLIKDQPKPKRARKPMSEEKKAKMLEVLRLGRIKAADKRKELSELKKAKAAEEAEKNEAVLTKYRKKKATVAEASPAEKTIQKPQENNEPTSELETMKQEMAELRKQLKGQKDKEEKAQLKKELEQLKNELKQEVKSTPVEPKKPEQQLPQKAVSAPVPIPQTPKRNVYSTYTGNIWGL